jgi:hypothetical protein
MKSLTLTLPLLAILGAATGCFVACGADTSNGNANGGTSGNAGNSPTSGAAGSGASGGGASNSAGTANEPSSGSGGAAGVGGAGASGGAAGASAGDGGAAGAGGASGAGGALFTDRCGGCNYTGGTPPICIYQTGGPGPGRFLCATQNPCGAAGACLCIVGQGACSPAPEDGSQGYCVCDNGLD